MSVFIANKRQERELGKIGKAISNLGQAITLLKKMCLIGELVYNVKSACRRVCIELAEPNRKLSEHLYLDSYLALLHGGKKTRTVSE